MPDKDFYDLLKDPFHELDSEALKVASWVVGINPDDQDVTNHELVKRFEIALDNYPLTSHEVKEDLAQRVGESMNLAIPKEGIINMITAAMRALYRVNVYSPDGRRSGLRDRLAEYEKQSVGERINGLGEWDELFVVQDS